MTVRTIVLAWLCIVVANAVGHHTHSNSSTSSLSTTHTISSSISATRHTRTASISLSTSASISLSVTASWTSSLSFSLSSSVSLSSTISTSTSLSFSSTTSVSQTWSPSASVSASLSQLMSSSNTLSITTATVSNTVTASSFRSKSNSSTITVSKSTSPRISQTATHSMMSSDSVSRNASVCGRSISLSSASSLTSTATGSHTLMTPSMSHTDSFSNSSSVSIATRKQSISVTVSVTASDSMSLSPSLTEAIKSKSTTISDSTTFSEAITSSVSESASSIASASQPSASHSVSSEPTSSHSQSQYAIEQMEQLVSWVSARPANTQSNIASTKFTLINATSLTAGEIPHDVIRWQGFILTFFVHEEIASRVFADFPPVTVSGASTGFLLQPSATSSTPNRSSFEVMLNPVTYNRFSFNTFEIQIGPYPEGKVPFPLIFTLDVIPVEFEISPTIETALTATAVVGAVVSGSPLIGSSLGRSVIMSAITVCEEGIQNSYLSLMNVGIGDVDSGYYYRGAVGGNMGLGALMLSIPVAVAGLMGIAARPSKRRETWLRCLSLLHLPSWTVVAGQLTVQPTVTASVALLVAWKTDSDIAVGCFGLLVTVVYVSWVTMLSREAPRLSLEDRPSPTEATQSVMAALSRHRLLRRIVPVWNIVKTLVSITESLRFHLRGTKHWHAVLTRWRTWKQEHHYLICFYDVRAGIVVEIWAQVAMSVMTGVVVGSKDYCIAHLSCLLLFYAAGLFAHLWWIPSISLRHHVAHLTVTSLWFGSAMYATIGIVLDSGNGSTSMLRGSSFLNVLTICVAVVAAIPEAIHRTLAAPQLIFSLYYASEYHREKDAKTQSKPFVAVPGPPTPPRTPTPVMEPAPPLPPFPRPPPTRRAPSVVELQQLRTKDAEAWLEAPQEPDPFSDPFEIVFPASPSRPFRAESVDFDEKATLSSFSGSSSSSSSTTTSSSVSTDASTASSHAVSRLTVAAVNFELL